MEFLSQNIINTTTQLSVTSNTATAVNIFSPDPYFQYYTDGCADDSLTASVTVTFDETTSVDRIALVDTNLKEFRIFYNGLTASTFNFDGVTTSSSFNANAETNMYLRPVTPVNCTSITIDMKKTITPNQEKRIGFLYLGNLVYETDRTPSASNYKPKVDPKQIMHTLSDGGVRINRIRNKWSVTIKYDHIELEERNAFRAIYDRVDPFVFCAFGTYTSWDAILFEANWVNDFDFYEYSDDAASAGFSGGISLKETPF